MADSNVNISVSADTSSAVGNLSILNTAFATMGESLDKGTAKMYSFGHTIQEVGQNMYSIGQRATMGISIPIAMAGKSMVGAGADMVAMHNTFKTVFGDMTTEAQSWAVSLGKSVGLSGGIIDHTNLQFRKMAGAFGLTGKDALDFSEKFTKLTLDVSAFNDIDITDATERMMSGMRGEADAVEKLGIFMGEAQLREEMLREGLKGQYSALTSVQRMTVLYNLALIQTSQASGQAEKEAISYQNSIANLKQSYKDLSEQFYMALQPAILDFLNDLTIMMAMLKKLSPEQIKFYANIAKWVVILPPVIMYLGAFIEGGGRILKLLAFLGKAFLNTGKNVAWLGTQLALLPTRLGLVALSIQSTCISIGTSFMTMCTSIVSVLGTTVPLIGISVGWLIIILAAIGIAVYLVIKYWDEIKAWTISTWGTILSFLTDVWNKVATVANTVWGSITGFFMDTWKGIVGLFTMCVTPIITQAISIFNQVALVVTTFGQNVWAVLSTIGGFFKYIWMGIIAPLVQYAGGLFTAIGGLIVWVVEQVIGMALTWLGKQFTWLYTAVLLPIGQGIMALFGVIGKFFMDTNTNYIQLAINSIGYGWIALCSTFKSMYNAYIVPILIAFKAGWFAVQVAFGTTIEALKAGWQSFVLSIGNLWNSYGVPIINSIKAVAQAVSNTWTIALNGARSAFHSFTSGLANAWGAIRSAFKLPHISISGSWDLTPPNISAPKLGVDWYAKGGIFSSATTIGVGEAGDEAVVPLSNKSKVAPFASAVAGQFIGMLPDNIKDSQKSNDSGVVIQVNGLVVREEADIEKIGQQLYKLQQRESRRMGRSGI